MRARWVLLICLLVAAAVAWWWLRRRDAPAPKALDVAAFRTQQAARLDRAKHVVPRAQPAAPAARDPRWPIQGQGAKPNTGKDLVTPQCWIGPPALCASLGNLIDGCDAGDAADCMAVGQFLADTPPRPLIANVFFMQACRIGDAEGCARYYALRETSSAPCDQDAFACEWRAYRTKDLALADQACSLGAADACAMLADANKTDAARARAYLETACQLGSPPACMGLGLALRPDCVASATQMCFPPDLAQSNAAFEIACDAGWDDACKQLGR